MNIKENFKTYLQEIGIENLGSYKLSNIKTITQGPDSKGIGDKITAFETHGHIFTQGFHEEIKTKTPNGVLGYEISLVSSLDTERNQRHTYSTIFAVGMLELSLTALDLEFDLSLVFDPSTLEIHSFHVIKNEAEFSFGFFLELLQPEIKYVLEIELNTGEKHQVILSNKKTV